VGRRRVVTARGPICHGGSGCGETRTRRRGGGAPTLSDGKVSCRVKRSSCGHGMGGCGLDGGGTGGPKEPMAAAQELVVWRFRVSTEAVMVCDERASDIYRCSHLTTNP
jgi:hypothetical protein